MKKLIALIFAAVFAAVSFAETETVGGVSYEYVISNGDAASFIAIVDWMRLYGGSLTSEERFQVIEKASEHCRQHPENLYLFAEMMKHISEPMPSSVKNQIVTSSASALLCLVERAESESEKQAAYDAAEGLTCLVQSIGEMPCEIKEYCVRTLLNAAVDQQRRYSGYPTLFEALPGMVLAVGEVSESLRKDMLDAMLNDLPEHENSIGIMIMYVEALGALSEFECNRIYQWAIELCKRLPACARNIMALIDCLHMEFSAEEKKELLDILFILASGEKNSDYSESNISTSSAVSLVVTNVVVRYVLNSVQPEFARPVSEDTGFVNVIAEVKGMSVAVPQTWAENYPEFAAKFGSDFTKALTMKSGKVAMGGREMLVWEDYVAGTDPTDPNDKFTASMTLVDGKPVISWTPELDAERTAMRKYTTYGKEKLTDSEWTVVPEGREGDYNFFKVTVEMK